MVEELYKRQTELDLSIPEKVCIVGVGGIGSWVALNMGLIGVPEIFLIDYDLVELHNLNRTPFRTLDVALQKTTALSLIIGERRPDTKVRVINKRIEELSDFELMDLSNALILDCRDNLEEIPIKNNKVVKLGYDGLSVTMIFNPKYGKLWDLEPEDTYSVVPSFLAPTQFLATGITTLLTDPEFNIEELSNKIVTFDIQEHFKGLLK
jgi:molybdopterin/thiamine biosynthesis adenylyltransferase